MTTPPLTLRQAAERVLEAVAKQHAVITSFDFGRCRCEIEDGPSKEDIDALRLALDESEAECAKLRAVVEAGKRVADECVIGSGTDIGPPSSGSLSILYAALASLDEPGPKGKETK